MRWSIALAWLVAGSAAFLSAAGHAREDEPRISSRRRAQMPAGEAAPAPTSETTAPTSETTNLPTNDTTDDSPAATTEPAVSDPSAPAERLKANAAEFDGVRPGRTTWPELLVAWGNPIEQGKAPAGGPKGRKLLVFCREPFDRIEVAIEGDVVRMLTVHFQTPVAADELAERIALVDARPVTVHHELGTAIGEAYPDRGVAFSFARGAAPRRVARMIVGEVRPEPFVLRAETVLRTRPDTSLADAEAAIALDPDYAAAHWVAARGLFELARIDDALNRAEAAVRLEPANLEYRLTRARLLAALGEQASGLRETREVIGDSRLRLELKARALCQIGDLLAAAPARDYGQAAEQHHEAIRAAGPASRDRRRDVRLSALETLFDAHLALAGDIAWGNFKRKDQVAVKWLERATAIADSLRAEDSAYDTMRFQVARQALAVHAGLAGERDPADWIERLVSEGERLIEAAESPRSRRRIERTLGLGLYDAVQIHQVRGQNNEALALARRAAELLDRPSEQLASADDEWLLARLDFRIGALTAADGKNHAGAVEWYEKALDRMDRAGHAANDEPGRLGEMHVTIGHSLWEIGERDRALALTERGRTLMTQAVERGLMSESQVTVALHNLAAMHRELGDEQQARSFEELAEQARDSSRR